MPIPGPARTFHCPDCNWQKTIIPQGDALTLDRDWFSSCPKCQNEELQSRTASMREVMRARLKSFFKGRT